MWELFKEYLTTVLRRWYVLAVTVSLALLGLVREVASSFWDINFTVPAWLWVSVFVVTFAVANFHTFLDVRKEPRLSFSLLSPIPTGNKRGGEIVRIKIENPNGPDIQNCQVNLESLTKHDGTDVDQHLPVAICTKIQTGKLRGTSSSFNLSWGLSQQLYFAWNPKKIVYKPQILTEFGNIELPEPGKYIAILQAAGSNTRPASYTLELDYKPDGQLDVTEVNTDDGAPHQQERGSSR